MTPTVRCLALAVAALALPWALRDATPVRATLPPPSVTSQILDASGGTVTDAVPEGAEVHISATVAGAGPPPSGAVSFLHYADPGCADPSIDGPTVALTTQSVPVAQTVDIPNDAGWDSATAWNANGVNQFATNWSGGLFTGNDNAFFASSSMAWRFTNVPVHPGDTVDRAYLDLRISQSRPSVAAEGTWTWKAVLAADTRDGSGFLGETRVTFLQRFNALGATWELPLNYATVDAFGSHDGASYAPSPDITALVRGRVANPSWALGGDVVIGLLNHGTMGIAEAYVVDQPGNAVLHVESTTLVEEQHADSGALTPPPGTQSFRAHYLGDGYYAPADGPCMSLDVTPALSVGGVAEEPRIAAAPAARRRSSDNTIAYALAAATLAALATVAGAARVNRRR